MLKRFFILYFCLALVVSRYAYSQEAGSIGFGVTLGQPLGPTLKVWRNRTQAINFGLGFDDDFAAYVDYQWHAWNVFSKTKSGRMSAYVAAGGLIQDEDDDNTEDEDTILAVRTLAGATYWLSSQPIEIFAEVGPAFELTPDTDVDFNFGLGLRCYFGEGNVRGR